MKRTNYEIIGIIGGAGVAATNKLITLIEESITRNGAFRDSHHPEMIIFQATSVPSRSMFLEGKGESFIPGYIDIGLKLKMAGATTLCMNCNTAHYAINEIQRAVEVPFINIVKEAVLKCQKTGNHKRIGLIASDGCLRGNVYEQYFQKILPGIEIVYPDEKMQKAVTLGINNIKNSKRFLSINHKERPRNIFIEVCNSLKNNGVDLIILGCTDIGVDFLPENFQSVEIIDSLSLLAEKIIEVSNTEYNEQ